MQNTTKKATKPYLQTENYLNESNLFIFLKSIFPNYNIIHNEVIPDLKQRIRPDFRIDEIKLIIEFDGVYHYTQPTSALSDIKNTQIYRNIGYNVIRLPYFIQLHTQVIIKLFGDYLDENIKNEIITHNWDYNIYPHGFINLKNVYPSQYCYLGLQRYQQDIVYFNNIITGLENTINESLIEAIIYKQSILSVVPLINMFEDIINKLPRILSDRFNDKTNTKRITQVNYDNVMYELEYLVH